MNKGGIIVFILMVSLVGSLVFLNLSTVDVSRELHGYAYKIGYLGDIEEDDKKIILSDYDSFKKYFEKNIDCKYDDYGNIISSSANYFFDRYDEYYFDGKSLAILYIETASGGIIVEYDEAVITGNSIFIGYDVDASNSITEDMSGYFVVVEVPKNVTSIRN